MMDYSGSYNVRCFGRVQLVRVPFKLSIEPFIEPFLSPFLLFLVSVPLFDSRKAAKGLCLLFTRVLFGSAPYLLRDLFAKHLLFANKSRSGPEAVTNKTRKKIDNEGILFYYVK